MDVPNEAVVEMNVNEAKFDLATIFHAQYKRIARAIKGVIRDPARAEELAVEVFLKWSRNPAAQGEGQKPGYTGRPYEADSMSYGSRHAAAGMNAWSIWFAGRPPRMKFSPPERKNNASALSSVSLSRGRQSWFFCAAMVSATTSWLAHSI